MLIALFHRAVTRRPESLSSCYCFLIQHYSTANSVDEGTRDISARFSRSRRAGIEAGGPLARFGRDLTQQAREGLLDPVVGREDVIARVVQILLRRTKNNPVLVGDAGVGKTAVVEGIAQLIAADTAPSRLSGARLVALDLAALLAGTGVRGDFEARVGELVTEVARSQGRVVLFIDELHTIVGAGAAEGGVDAANLLKPSLARGELRCIGATTHEEYLQHIARDPALARRFQPVSVEEPSEEATLAILQGLAPRYAAHHGATFAGGALVSAVRCAKRYVSERRLPDSAIDLMDEAAALAVLEKSSVFQGNSPASDFAASGSGHMNNLAYGGSSSRVGTAYQGSASSSSSNSTSISNEKDTTRPSFGHAPRSSSPSSSDDTTSRRGGISKPSSEQVTQSEYLLHHGRSAVHFNSMHASDPSTSSQPHPEQRTGIETLAKTGYQEVTAGYKMPGSTPDVGYSPLHRSQFPSATEYNREPLARSQSSQHSLSPSGHASNRMRKSEDEMAISSLVSSNSPSPSRAQERICPHCATSVPGHHDRIVLRCPSCRTRFLNVAPEKLMLGTTVALAHLYSGPVILSSDHDQMHGQVHRAYTSMAARSLSEVPAQVRLRDLDHTYEHAHLAGQPGSAKCSVGSYEEVAVSFRESGIERVWVDKSRVAESSYLGGYSTSLHPKQDGDRVGIGEYREDINGSHRPAHLDNNRSKLTWPGSPSNGYRSDQAGSQPRDALLTSTDDVPIRVTEAHVLQVTAALVGTPVDSLAPATSAASSAHYLDAALRQAVIGQDSAVRSVSGAIKLWLSGLGRSHRQSNSLEHGGSLRSIGHVHMTDSFDRSTTAACAWSQPPARPMGILLTGPSGVGKSSLAAALAPALFGDSRAAVSIHGAELAERTSMSRLVGASPGYVGYGQGGLLTEAVRRRPHCVITVHDADAAHPEVLDLLLSMLERGSITDGAGRKVDFRHSVLVLIINSPSGGSASAVASASGVAYRAANGRDHRDSEPMLDGHATSGAGRSSLKTVTEQRSARQRLVSELSSRVDCIAHFEPLQPHALRSIATRLLNDLAADVLQQYRVKLQIGEDVLTWLSCHCKSSSHGARPLEALIRDSIMIPLVDLLVQLSITASSGLHDLDNDHTVQVAACEDVLLVNLK